MDTRIIKFFVAAAAIAYAVKLMTEGYWGSGIGMLLLGALLVVVALRSMRMLMVFLKMRQQKLEDAQKWISRINPNRLWKRQRGYYHFLKGSMLLETSLSKAENELKLALSEGLKQGHDKAAVKLNLAAISAAKGRRKIALVLLNEAKRLDKKGMLKADIRTIEQGIKNPKMQMRRRR